MVINNFGPGDAGTYQVVVTNSFGSVTSAPVQLAIHAVNASGTAPVPPYSSWANAATNIQDAINVAAPSDIVLVTNGIYAYGGMAVTGALTNRVTLNQAITVISVNGYSGTTIQGAWDPISTNGPGAVRCAWVGNGAVLNGFTLENGATLATGDFFQFGPLESGGGVWCVSTNAVVLNCEMTNNSAVYGAGTAYGTVDNSLIVGNLATYGGGAALSSLNNCTVINNEAFLGNAGAGTCGAIVRNSIVVENYDLRNSAPFNLDDAQVSGGVVGTPNYAYSCVDESGLPLNEGNIINPSPIFVDLYHLSILSPCCGAGSAAYSAGYDLDGEPWNNPPSMGCSEMIASNLVGPLSVNYSALYTNLLANRFDYFSGIIQGRAAYLTWSFGDGLIYSNFGDASFHEWTNGGNYPVTFTAFNNDNPKGVSTSVVVQVQSLLPVQIQPQMSITNGFQFQFTGQINADYLIEYATNLTPSISWHPLQSIFYNTQSNIQILDPSATNAARFYRVQTD
jgi:hypothetical protein